ncbi:MAG: hypothetical protein ACI8S3_001579 [Alphaproteobacteria bacterium]|jgi:hypothetical protein
MTRQTRPEEFQPDNINIIWTKPDPVATVRLADAEIQSPDNLNIIWTTPDPVDTVRLADAEFYSPDYLEEAELVRSAEHLRHQVIGDAFTRLFRRLRAHLKTWAKTAASVRLADEPTEPIDQAEVTRLAEQLRAQVIGDAFTRLFRRLRTHHKTRAKTVASVRLADEPPEPIDEAEIVRHAEQLRAQVIGDAFAQFSRHRRTHHNRAVQQFVGAYSVASSGTGAR